MKNEEVYAFLHGAWWGFLLGIMTCCVIFGSWFLF